VLFKEQPLPSGSFSEKKVHFQAADIAAIKSCSLRGIEARTGRLTLRYLGANGILDEHGRNDDHRSLIIQCFFTKLLTSFHPETAYCGGVGV
jgi:hypothetical protein